MCEIFLFLFISILRFLVFALHLKSRIPSLIYAFCESFSRFPRHRLMSSTQSDSTVDHGTSPAVSDPSIVQQRTELGQCLVQEAVDGCLPSETLLNNLRNEGFSPREANDYIDQFTQLSKLRNNSNTHPNCQDEECQSRPISPRSHRQGGTEPDVERRNKEAAEVAWAVLRT